MASVDPAPRSPSASAVGGTLFAATMLTIVGCFQAIAGLVAIIDDNFYVKAQHYTFNMSTNRYGWIHLILGGLILLTGLGLFARQGWAVMAGVFFASLSAIANFFFVPYYPFWTVLIIAIDVWVIWSLTRRGIVEP